MADSARTYPAGVTCWVDTEQPDLDAARDFYSRLFGWQFHDAMPPDAPGSYLIATLEGKDVAAVGPSGSDSASWNTYIAVDDADAAAQAVTGNGGQVLAGPADAGPGGRSASCSDPGGVTFRLWQARKRLGAQFVNAPGGWNFSHLRAPDDATLRDFYGTVFGWQFSDIPGLGVAITVAGYGQHLAETSDPDIYERQAGAPEGFADVVSSLQPPPPGQPAHWHAMFSVADRDVAADTVRELGGTVTDTAEGEWTRTAEVTDPQGARFTLSQFTPPG